MSLSTVSQILMWAVVLLCGPLMSMKPKGLLWALGLTVEIVLGFICFGLILAMGLK